MKETIALNNTKTTAKSTDTATKSKKHFLKVRLGAYLLGLFIMTMGIAMSVKSNLGVSPVSSIPYTITCITGLEMGKATIVFHVVLVGLQILILRKAFKIKNLLQVVIGVVFGYFTTFCNYLFTFLPTPELMVVRLLMMLVSAVLIAAGIFFYLPADIVPLAGEGFMQAVSQVTGIVFDRVKVGFDVTMVVVSLISCLLVLHRLGSVGVGTIAAAFLVGIFVGIINRHFGAWRDQIMGITSRYV